MKIAAEHIAISIKTAKILKDVTVQAGEKEIVGIIGPNGSGKSTLLKCIYRVLKPDRGAVCLGGELLSSMSTKKSASKVAVVAQHNYYDFDFSVHEIVLMGRAPYKKALERDNEEDYRIVEEVLEKVGISGFAQRSFATLSGGEQQRVILARALAQQTACLILDEPTNHLDVTHQLQLMNTIQELELTVIAAFHDLNIAAAYCDRLYILKEGRIVGQGAPKELLTPQFIEAVYHVETEVIFDRNGKMHILFLS